MTRPRSHHLCRHGTPRLCRPAKEQRQRLYTQVLHTDGARAWSEFKQTEVHLCSHVQRFKDKGFETISVSQQGELGGDSAQRQAEPVSLVPPRSAWSHTDRAQPPDSTTPSSPASPGQQLERPPVQQLL